jgi:hypothetical protein
LEIFYKEMKKIIGISGLAGDGKDSVCNILRKFFLENTNYQFKKIALADALKEECRSACFDMFGVDSVSCSRQDKEKIRDFLVFYGKIMRNKTKGTHWTSLVEKEITASRSKNIVFCIPDIRYAEFPNDEVFWLKSHKDSSLIHVKKYFSNVIELEGQYKVIKSYSSPVNKEEEKNCPKLERLASHQIEWQDFSPTLPEDEPNCIESVYTVARDIFDSWKEK